MYWTSVAELDENKEPKAFRGEKTMLGIRAERPLLRGLSKAIENNVKSSSNNDPRVQLIEFKINELTRENKSATTIFRNYFSFFLGSNNKNEKILALQKIKNKFVSDSNFVLTKSNLKKLLKNNEIISLKSGFFQHECKDILEELFDTEFKSKFCTSDIYKKSDNIIENNLEKNISINGQNKKIHVKTQLQKFDNLAFIYNSKNNKFYGGYFSFGLLNENGFSGFKQEFKFNEIKLDNFEFYVGKFNFGIKTRNEFHINTVNDCTGYYMSIFAENLPV